MNVVELYANNRQLVRDTVDENVDFYFSDAEEIGSSDVSICVNSVIRNLGLNREDVSNDEFLFLRQMVNNAIQQLAY